MTEQPILVSTEGTAEEHEHGQALGHAYQAGMRSGSPVHTGGPPGHKRTILRNDFRRAILSACCFANHVHDRYDAEYMGLVAHHPAMTVFGDWARRLGDPAIEFLARKTVLHYRGKAKDEDKRPQGCTHGGAW